MSSTVGREDIVREARAFLGVPYLHQGRTRNGIDCVGLLIVVAHRLGISDFDIDGYSRLPSNRMMQRMMREHLDEITMADVLAGDVVHMAFGMQPHHLAVVTEKQPFSIIHSDAERGRVVEHVIDNDWMTHIRGFYRVSSSG